MFRSGWILIFAALVPWAAPASDFDYGQIPDAIERCEGRLVVAARKAPTLDESLKTYVARLSRLKREGRFYSSMSREYAAAPLTQFINRRYEQSPDLAALSQAGLVASLTESHLDILSSTKFRLLFRQELDEPLWRIQYHADGSDAGYVSLIGWTRTRHLRYADHQIRPVAVLPSGFVADVPIPRVDAREVGAERQRLDAYAGHPRAESLVLDALGELAERLVDRIDAACEGAAPLNTPRVRAPGEYPHSLLGLAALALRRDPVMRQMIADAINEHVHGRARVRAVFDVDRVFVVSSVACGDRSLELKIHADPFTHPSGWGELD